MAVTVERRDFDALVEHGAFSRGFVVPEPARVRVPKVGRDDGRRQRAADGFVHRPPEHLLRLMVPGRDQAVLVHRHDSVERRVDDRPRAGFGLTESRFDAPSLDNFVPEIVVDDGQLGRPLRDLSLQPIQLADAAGRIEETEHEERGAKHDEAELIGFPSRL